VLNSKLLLVAAAGLLICAFAELRFQIRDIREHVAHLEEVIHLERERNQE